MYYYHNERVSILTWLSDKDLRINSTTKASFQKKKERKKDSFPPKKSRDFSKANNQDVNTTK